MTAHPEAASAILGALAGFVLSIIAGVVLLWVKRTVQTRDRQADLASKVTGVHVSVEHNGRYIRELRADTKERFREVNARLDALPCKDVCATVTALKGGRDERRQAAT